MLKKPYLIFLGDVQSESLAKTAFGIRDWARDDVVGQWRLPGCAVDLGLPELSPAQAAALGAQSMLIGVASIGGQIPHQWRAALIEAAVAGLDIISGMHARLRDVDGLAASADARGRELHDVRHADRSFPIGTGRKRSGLRLLTVGTDCALGKKYTALALTRALKERGVAADFRATGQTGIMISGAGVAVDAVIADFLSGAAETLSPDAPDGHWDVIEGQGSLFHPAYAGVTLGLIHGSQPDAMVLCHDPLRTEVHSFPGFALPSLKVAASRYVEAARLVNPAAMVVGIALNTSRLGDEQARQFAAEASAECGVPAFDPMRFGLEAAVSYLLQLFPYSTTLERSARV